MDNHTLRLLELDELRNLVAAHAVCEMGRRRVMVLPVLTLRESLLKEYAKLDEMMKIISSMGDIPTEGITDIQPLIDRIVVVNSYLEPAGYMQIFNFLSSATNILSFFDDCKETHSHLYELTRGLIPLPSYKQLIREVFSTDGEVKDDASDALKEIRQRKKELSKRIDGTLEKYLYDPIKRVLLQDQFITERNYRKVLPVRVECKHQIRGIIHASRHYPRVFHNRGDGIH
jgi:DNA mismatch repair protein MutS2